MTLPIIPPAGDSRPFDVVGFGQNSVDIVAVVSSYPEPDSHAPVEQFLELPGGEIATAMVACARMGCRSRYLGTVGANGHGQLVRSTLEREGVDIAKLRQVEAPNRLAIILVDPNGRRTVLWHRDARLRTAPEEVDLGAVTSGRVLLVDAIDPEASALAARAARRVGIPTVIDVDVVRPAIETVLEETDIVIASAAFPEALTGTLGLGAALRSMASQFRPAAVVVTLGADGALALVNGREVRTAAVRVNVTDTTGAGDAFRGGFIASWIRLGNQAEIDTLLQYASAAAALNCRAIGAQTGLPSWEEVAALVTRTPGDRSN